MNILTEKGDSDPIICGEFFNLHCLSLCDLIFGFWLEG